MRFMMMMAKNNSDKTEEERKDFLAQVPEGSSKLVEAAMFNLNRKKERAT
jgi:hypothetical protein